MTSSRLEELRAASLHTYMYHISYVSVYNRKHHGTIRDLKRRSAE